jgi:hypothetical protein
MMMTSFSILKRRDMATSTSKSPHANSYSHTKHTRSALIANTAARLLPTLQSVFESQRDQFVAGALDCAEWQRAEEAVERAQRACVCRAPSHEIEQLCCEAKQRVALAVERSLVYGEEAVTAH